MPNYKLNIFQRLVRQWDRLHPYNAAQLIKLDGAADIDAINHAWAESIFDLQLGRITVRRHRYRCTALDEVDGHLPRVVTGQSLEDFISDELNEPFDRRDYFPFRPFILQQRDSHYLGIVYQHWIADSVSIRMLLREWFLRIYDPKKARRKPFTHAEGGYWRYFGPGSAHWNLGDSLLSSVRWSSRFKRVRRLEDPQANDYRVHFSMHELPAGWVNALHATAKLRRMTLNDLFLASIAMTANEHVPVLPWYNRQDLALGTIVDLRRYVRQDLSDVFGLFLGFTSVILRPQHLEDFDDLLRVISNQSEHHKKTGVPQASPLRMAAGILAGKLLDRRGVSNFYRKRVPLAAGISNVNLNTCWSAQYHPHPIKQYIRVSPTGPMMPVVFTTTTLGRSFHFGLTRRISVIPDSAPIAQTFVQRLDNLLPAPVIMRGAATGVTANGQAILSAPGNDDRPEKDLHRHLGNFPGHDRLEAASG